MWQKREENNMQKKISIKKQVLVTFSFLLTSNDRKIYISITTRAYFNILFIKITEVINDLTSLNI